MLYYIITNMLSHIDITNIMLGEIEGSVASPLSAPKRSALKDTISQYSVLCYVIYSNLYDIIV